MEGCAGMVWFSFNLPARLNAAVSDDEGAEVPCTDDPTEASTCRVNDN